MRIETELYELRSMVPGGFPPRDVIHTRMVLHPWLLFGADQRARLVRDVDQAVREVITKHAIAAIERGDI